MAYFITLAIGAVLGCLLMVFIFGKRIRRAELLAEDAERKFEDANRQAQINAADRTSIADASKVLEINLSEYNAKRSAFEAQVVSYSDLSRENGILKRDLQNLDVNLHKLRMDTELQRDRQETLDARAADLARRHLADTVRSISGAINASNYTACRDRLATAISRIRDIGFTISDAEEQAYHADLKAEFELEVKKSITREEQARLKERIREEQRILRDSQRAKEKADQEKRALEAELALAAARNEHSAEIDRLKALIAEAEAAGQRAISQAQLTKAGHVYVISNIGSFGQDVFKVGMTRRLDPEDRIWELGDASVPFPFDIHLLVQCNDAPSLEHALHQALHRCRLNRVNPRKEFFRTDLQTILDVVKRHHGEVVYTATPEALEYRQSLTMSEADADYIEHVFEGADEEAGDTALTSAESE